MGTSKARGVARTLIQVLPVSDLRRRPRRFDSGQTGAAFVEYITVLLLVAVIAAAATFSLGRPFVDYFRFAQLILSMPFP